MAFDRIKKAVGAGFGTGGGKVRGLVEAALLPLTAVSDTLHARCVDFVVDGSNLELLMELAASRDPLRDGVLVAPGQLLGWFEVPEPALEALARFGLMQRNAAGDFPYVTPRLLRRRDPLYRSTDLTLQQWVRWGRLLAEVGAGPNRVADGVPLWFLALVNDVLATCPSDGRASRDIAIVRQHWSPEFLAALLVDAGAPPDDVAEVLMLALYQDAGGYQGMTPLPSVLPGVRDYLAAHGSSISGTSVARLAAAGRVRLAEEAIKDPAVARGIAHLMAAMSVDTSKLARQAAVKAMGNIPTDVLITNLAPVLAKATAARASELVQFLSAVEGGMDVLSTAAAANPKLAVALDQLSRRRDIVGERPDEQTMEIPPFTPIPDAPAGPAKPELRRELDKMIEFGKATKEKWVRDQAKAAASVTEADLDAVVAIAEGRSDATSRLVKALGEWWVGNAAPSLTLIHLVRLADRKPEPTHPWLLHRRGDAETDPRTLQDAMERAGLADAEAVTDAWVWSVSDAEAAWPWAAEHLDRLRQRLSAVETTPGALEVLEHFPSVPAELVPIIAQVAVGASRVNRPLAQRVLQRHPAARQLAEQALTDSRGEVRAASATWLALLADPAAIPALRAALAKEKREVARAGLLRALEACGDDIAAELAPTTLLAEATKGLQAKPPASMAWFDDRLLPPVRWADGSSVDPQIIRWWVVLAVKLKDPRGLGLIDLYLGQLLPEDAAALGAAVAHAWIAQDTRHPSDEQSREYAAVHGPHHRQDAQAWLAQVKASPFMAEFVADLEAAAAAPVERFIAEAYAAHQRTYLGSAVADKGMLALTTRMAGIDLANIVAAYLKDNPGRRSQADSLVNALFANAQPAALQLLLSIARRYKMATVQELALRLVQELAEARGWTTDELADRTIPAAGFSEDRLLHLDYGAREFIGRLTPTGTIELSNADGIPIKGLPDARQNEDAELVAAAKKQLTAARKEAKSVLTLQASRLYEAMCVERVWESRDWTEFIAGHPLVSQLLTRLIWVENPGPDQRCFRPSEDGALLGLDDDSIEFSDTARVGLAHGVRLSAAEAAGWRAHLKDYQVKPLFDQFTSTVPDFAPGATELDDLKGHVTDTFTFRGVAGKRGYARAEVVDGGWFVDYQKLFTGPGIVALLTFTGSSLPETNMACATQTLSFRRGRRGIPLADVPPIMLAECYADYAALAALGPFDPDYAMHIGG